MRFVTHIPPDGQPRAGVLLGHLVVDLAAAAPLVLPDTAALRWDMLSLLRADQEDVNLDTAADIVAAVMGMIDQDDDLTDAADALEGNGRHDHGPTGNVSIGGVEMLLPLDQVRLLAPLPQPPSMRMFDTFAGATPRPPEWYHLPGFAFGNHQAIYGPDADILLPQSDMCTYGMEVACVIGWQGRDIFVEEATSYIAGYSIVNNWTALDLLAEEAPLGLGAPKARDFATSLGPWLVTPDELELYADDERYMLTMLARVNTVERTRENLINMHHSFAQMIAYASRDATLYPGDILTSGTVPGTTGSLARGDLVEVEVTGLGVLHNRIV